MLVELRVQLYPLLLQLASGELELHDLKSVPPVYMPEFRTVGGLISCLQIFREFSWVF